MSKPLGAGTANITYNGPADEADMLNRLAAQLSVTRGELLREAVLAGIQGIRKTTAQQIARIRAERQLMKHGERSALADDRQMTLPLPFVAILSAVTLAFCFQAMSGDQQVARRLARRTRRNETELAAIFPTLTEPMAGEA